MPISQVILLSGGVESATLLHAEREHGLLHPVFIDYAQRAAAQERRAAAAQCAALGLSLKRLDMAELGRAFREGQSKQYHVPLPHRNLVILGVGLSYASQVGAQRLCLALNREDLAGYASAGPSFLQAFRALAATLERIEVATPFAHLGKAEIIRMGHGLGVDYRYTYSCLLGRMPPCGRCPQCLKRKTAFAAARLPDPGASPAEAASRP